MRWGGECRLRRELRPAQVGSGSPRRLAGLAWLPALALLLGPVGASGVTELARSEAAFRWTPASGPSPVVGYLVYVARDGGAFRHEAFAPDTTASVSGSVGESIRVRVAALDALYRIGPQSQSSEEVRFVSSAGGAAGGGSSGPDAGSSDAGGETSSSGGGTTGDGDIAASPGATDAAASAPEGAEATLGWTPASSTWPLLGYLVYVAREGGAFQQEAFVPTNRATVGGRIGESIRVKVAGLDQRLHLGPESPSSDVVVLGASGGGGAPSGTFGVGPAWRSSPAVGLGPAVSGTIDVLNPDGSTAMVAGASGFPAAAVRDARPALCDFDGDGRDELAVGLGPGSDGRVSIRDDARSGFAQLGFVDVGWEQYNRDNGETFPGCGDVDGDGRDELMVGFGEGGGGWLVLLDDAVRKFAPLVGSGYVRLGVGTTMATAADVDGDGRDEILVGIGSRGRVAVYDDAAAQFGVISGSVTLGNGYAGEVRPAACDVDGDGRDELVLGLDATGGGRAEVLEDAFLSFRTLGSLTLGWDGYRAVNGEVWPTCGDLDGDGRAEVLLGLGPGGSAFLRAFDDGKTGFAPLLGSRTNAEGWLQLRRPLYADRDGRTRPSLGR